MREHDTFKRTGTCIPTEDGRRCILLHPHKPTWTIINEVGSRIYSLCDGHHPIEDIAHHISRQYNQPQALVIPDIMSFVAGLERHGFLVSPDSPPLHQKIHQTKTCGQSPTLKRVSLYITENCNLQCRHCGLMNGAEAHGSLSIEQIFKVIDEAKAIGVKSLSITGGEPLLRPDCLDILTYASQRVKTALVTNGTLIDDQVAGTLATLGLPVQISLDGPQDDVHDYLRGTGSFKKLGRALDLLSATGSGSKITLCVTLTRKTVRHIPAILNLACKKGIFFLRFLPLQRMGRAVTSWNELSPSDHEYNQVYQYLHCEVSVQFPELHISAGLPGLVLSHPSDGTSWCFIGELLIIDARGDVYPCHLLMAPPFKLGNILEMSLQQAFESSTMKRIAEICIHRKETIPGCKECMWRHFCQGGCPGMIYRLKGTLHEVDDFCELRRNLYPKIILDLAAHRSSFSPHEPKSNYEGC